MEFAPATFSRLSSRLARSPGVPQSDGRREGWMDWVLHHKGLLTATVLGVLAVAMVLSAAVDSLRRRR